MNNTPLDNHIKIMQDNIKYLRKIINWTGEDLAHAIGVTKQLISRFENDQSKISKTQYIAIRTIFMAKCKKHKDMHILNLALNLLFSIGIEYDTEIYHRVHSIIKTISAISAYELDRNVYTIIDTLINDLDLRFNIKDLYIDVDEHWLISLI